MNVSPASLQWLLGAVALCAMTACRNEADEAFGFLNQIATTTSQADEFRSRLGDWLELNQFTVIDDPGSGIPRGRLQTTSAKAKWYQGAFGGSVPFMVRITESTTGAGKVLFHGDTYWVLEGYESEHAEMRNKTRAFREALLKSVSGGPTA